jgi:cytochrome P450
MAFSIATVIWQLLYQPSARARATAEVRAAFSRAHDIRNGPTLESCAYLQACISETMRLYPPIANYLPRHVQAGGLAVDDQYLPESTQVGVVNYSLFRNPTYFPDPLTWRPRRRVRHDGRKCTAGGEGLFPIQCRPQSLCRPNGCRVGVAHRARPRVVDL